MGNTQEEPYIDNDIALYKRKCNDIDNALLLQLSPRKKILGEITEYKLRIIKDFMFGNMCQNFGDCTTFVTPAIQQVERFTYVWMNELSEEGRKLVINYYLHNDKDDNRREYSDYLKSPVWKYISSIIKMLGGYTCEKCGIKENPRGLVVHHYSYAHLGSELKHLDEVGVLCRGCHRKIHGIRGKDE